MKLKTLASIAGAAAFGLGAIASWAPPSQAQMATYFCDKARDGVYATFARNGAGKEIEIIRWEKEWGDGTLTKQKRCEIVSERFQRASKAGVLQHVTHGVQNGQPVICAAQQYGGPCGPVLLTLRQEDNAREVLNQLLGIGNRAAGPLIQADDGQPQLYIDMKKVLGQ